MPAPGSRYHSSLVTSVKLEYAGMILHYMHPVRYGNNSTGLWTMLYKEIKITADNCQHTPTFSRGMRTASNTWGLMANVIFMGVTRCFADRKCTYLSISRPRNTWLTYLLWCCPVFELRIKQSNVFLGALHLTYCSQDRSPCPFSTDLWSTLYKEIKIAADNCQHTHGVLSP